VRKPKSDFVLTAAKVVSEAIGEDLFSGTPIQKSNMVGINKPGRAGGLKGGKARAEKLSSVQKSDIAKRAATARWKK
jgi:hypothetical protein